MPGGETVEKSEYTRENYVYDDPSTGYYRYIGSDIAGTSYDVAKVKMGGSWRMPSLEQMKELINNCTREWISRNGVNGILVTGSNGGQIFLPAAGYRWHHDSLNYEGRSGFFWSNSADPNDSDYAYDLSSSPGNWYLDKHNRYYGLSVRAVCP